MHSENIQLNELSYNKINPKSILNGIDIIFKNISYSVNVVDENQTARVIPCKKTYKKK